MNARTTADWTDYVETLPPEGLATALWVESDRMGFAVDAVSESRVIAESRVVENEERDMLIDRSAGGERGLLDHELYPAWHPYSTLADENDEVDGLGAADVRAFLATWYTPRNAILAIAGRFDRDETLALVRRYFEPIVTFDPPARPALPPSHARRMHLFVRANVFNDTVTVAWRTPSAGTLDDTALDVVATALAGPGNQRFARSLIATHLATQVGARQISLRETSVFVVQATCAPKVDPRTVLRAIEDGVKAFPATVTAREVTQSLLNWTVGTLAALETPAARTSVMANAVRSGNDLGARSLSSLDLHRGVTKTELATVVTRWLGPEHRVASSVFVDRAAPVRGRLDHRDEGEP